MSKLTSSKNLKTFIACFIFGIIVIVIIRNVFMRREYFDGGDGGYGKIGEFACDAGGREGGLQVCNNMINLRPYPNTQYGEDPSLQHWVDQHFPEWAYHVVSCPQTTPVVFD